jgi:hypothetical protein
MEPDQGAKMTYAEKLAESSRLLKEFGQAHKDWQDFAANSTDRDESYWSEIQALRLKMLSAHSKWQKCQRELFEQE